MSTEIKQPVEYLHNKYLYVFPVNSKIFVNGNKLSIEIFNRKVSNIAPYIRNRADVKKDCRFKIGLPVTFSGSELCKEYQAVADYLEKHPKLDFLHFEYATSHELALCTFFKSADLINTGKLLTGIKQEMPFLINIFRRPLIHLKEENIIQPVDAVKRINHNTIRHLSVHAENWENIRSDGTIVPAKLLTKVYDDDYSIYENVVFRDLVDSVLIFLKKKIYFLTEILDTFKDSIQIDAINKLNHQKYYLSIGKLYVGFSKMENSSEILAMLESTKLMYKQLNKYKIRAVYTKNAHVKPVSGEVKRTNILTMHKDYKHVYSLYKKFRKNSAESYEPGVYEKQIQSQTNYEKFCQMLITFAVSNFNFLCKSENAIFENGQLNAYFEYKNWSLEVKSESNDILDINAVSIKMSHSVRTVSMLIMPVSYYIPNDRKKHYERIVERLYDAGVVYNKYVFFEPYDFDDNTPVSYSQHFNAMDANLHYAVLPVSITEINSFRRIQKLLLECMVLSDDENTVCAFCGELMTKETGSKCLCHKCRTAVRTINCGHCGESFKATYIDIKNKNRNEKSDDISEFLEFYRQEKLFLFRNITPMNEKYFFCPFCGGENKV